MAQTVEKVYKLTVEGVDSINGLKTAIEQLTDKLGTLNEQTKEYKETLEQLTELQGKLSEGLANIDTSAMDSFVEGLAQGMAEAAAEVTEVKTNLEDLSQINSVKDLKQHVSDLRDRLVTLEKGSDEYNKTVQELIDAQVKMKDVMNAGKNEMKAAEGSYNALSQRMSALKQIWKETTDEATRNEIGKQINEINNQLKAMDASIGNNQRNVGNYKSALDGLETSFVKWKQELRECKEALEQLDPSTQEYADTMARASELTHLMADQQEMIKYSSADLGDQLNNIRGIASNLAAGYSAVNAAMGLFGQENEEVQQAMLKVQQAMALVQGLQGIDGFIKRTKGLSQSMGLVTKATQANTVATKANATASKQDAVAKGAEAAATAGAVPAQLSLNAAMEANPIGFIIGLIAALVTAMMLLKDKIMELIGGNEKMSAAFEKVKAVLAGVGNVIKKSVINPIKMAIIPIKTLAKVMIDVFKGDWSAIGDDIKAGAEEMKDTVIDTINVVGAFKEGYDKKTAEQDEARRKAAAAARQKELEDIIKDNESKYGSDWKYTDDAKKLYEEMFRQRMAQYTEDSDEYREAQRDKWAYDREYADKQQEAADKAAEEEKKRQEQAAKEAKQRRDKMLADFKSAFSQYIPEWDKLIQTIPDLYKKWGNGISYFKQELIKAYKEIGYSYSDATKKVEEIISEMEGKFSNALYSNMAKIMRDEYEKSFYTWDKTLSDFIKNENAKFEENGLRIGLEMPEEAIRHYNDIFEAQMEVLKKELNELNSDIDNFYETITTMDSRYAGMAMEDIAKIIPEFQKMLDKRNELEASEGRIRIDNFKQISEIIKGEYEKELSAMTKTYDQRKQLLENYYEWSENERKNVFYENEIEDLNMMKEYYGEYYSMLIKYYEEQRDKYLQMSNDMTLTAEERANAEIKAAEMIAEVHQAVYNRDLAMLKNQKEMYKAWANAVKDTVKSVGDIMSTISDSWESLIDLEREEIKTELENGKISQAEADRREAQNKESFENLKKFQIAQAIINALSAAVSAYQSMASIPYVGPALGAVAAAAALAAGYANVRQIQATNYESSSTGGGSSSTNFQLPSVLELEPELRQNLTNQSDIDELNNNGSGGGRGGGNEPIECYVVESSITAKQELAHKRKEEVTF